MFTPNLGESIQFDVFQMGWFNHQLAVWKLNLETRGLVLILFIQFLEAKLWVDDATTTPLKTHLTLENHKF